LSAFRAGTSFSPRRCTRFGLRAEAAFGDVLALGLDPVRLSAYWDSIRKDGFGELDRLLDMAADAGRSVVLTVGMKAIQWPEFYLPEGLAPAVRRSGRIGTEPAFAAAAMGFVSEVVARYRDHPSIAAWQVENEPFNRSGPHGWWIDPALVRREVAAVRKLDSRRIVLNAFNHFNAAVDRSSRPRIAPFGLRRLVPEREILDVLQPGDVLGLDAYTAIGAGAEGERIVRRADPDWADRAASWLDRARSAGRDAWIIEAQAEPWEASGETWTNPQTFAPDDIGLVFGRLAGAGYSTILLWGCEYWLWRASAGDDRWLEAARGIVRGG